MASALARAANDAAMDARRGPDRDHRRGPPPGPPGGPPSFTIDREKVRPAASDMPQLEQSLRASCLHRMICPWRCPPRNAPHTLSPSSIDTPASEIKEQLLTPFQRSPFHLQTCPLLLRVFPKVGQIQTCLMSALSGEMYRGWHPPQLRSAPGADLPGDLRAFAVRTITPGGVLIACLRWLCRWAASTRWTSSSATGSSQRERCKSTRGWMRRCGSWRTS